MQRRGDDSIRAKIARARARTSGRRRPPSRPPVRKRRVPRREIEARRQRILRWGVAVAGALVLLLVGGGLVYERLIKPNQTLATVGTETISRQEYWQWRANDLLEQAQQYRDFAQFVGPDQRDQYLAVADQNLARVPEVWGSTEVDPTALQSMIDGQIFVQGLDDLGLDVTPQEVETFALNRFAPPGAPLLPPSPTPTFTAERAAMVTSTAAAILATPIATPVAGSPVAATSVVSGAPVGTPIASPAVGTPGATPVSAAPTVSPATPNPAEARATAEAGFAQFAADFFALGRLSRADYERLIVAPSLARQEITAALAADIGQAAPQVRAAHILLPTEQAAVAARERVVEGGEPFAAVAAEVSTDEGTAANGGDLGWFTRQEMVEPFAEAAFALEPGAVSQPVQTEFGWHLIRVEETDPDRPLTDAQINRLRQAVVERWLEEQRASLAISADLPPTPTPFANQFQPPVGAPPPPTPTPPPATPVG